MGHSGYHPSRDPQFLVASRYLINSSHPSSSSTPSLNNKMKFDTNSSLSTIRKELITFKYRQRRQVYFLFEIVFVNIIALDI